MQVLEKQDGHPTDRSIDTVFQIWSRLEHVEQLVYDFGSKLLSSCASSYHKSRLGTSLRILALCWLACISKTAQVISKVVGVLLNQKRVLVTHVFGGSWIFVNFFGIHVCFQQCQVFMEFIDPTPIPLGFSSQHGQCGPRIEGHLPFCTKQSLTTCEDCSIFWACPAV